MADGVVVLDNVIYTVGSIHATTSALQIRTGTRRRAATYNASVRRVAPVCVRQGPALQKDRYAHGNRKLGYAALCKQLTTQ